jgi:hypothetical protein
VIVVIPTIDINKSFEIFEREFNKRVGALESYNLDKDKLVQEIQMLEDSIKEPKQMLLLVTSTLEDFKNDYTEKYSMEVTSALSQIIEHTGYTIDCKLTFSTDGKQMLVKMKNTYPNGKELEGTPEQIHGGGFRDLTAVIFGLDYIHQKDELVGPILLDEPTKQLSNGYSAPFYEYLEETVTELGNQLILITHDTDIISDARFGHHVIEIRLENDGSSQILTRK